MVPLHRQSLWMGRSAPRDSTLGFGRTGLRSGSESHARGEMLSDGSESHFLCFAPTGSGKTRSAVVPNLLQWPGSAVVIDVKKAELCRVTARRRREMGQEVIVLDPFAETGLASGALNPLEIFSLPTAQTEADSESLASLFAGQGVLSKDPFWDAHGTSLLAAVIGHVARLPAAERTLSQVFKLLFGDDVIYNLAVLLDTVGKTMPPSAYRDIASLLQMPDVTRGGVLATTQSYLKCLQSPGVLRSLDSTSFSLVDFILGKPMTIYLILPIERVASHRSLLKIWIGTLLRAVTARSFQARTPTLFLLDECGQLGSFPFLETFITLCRAYSCRVMAFFQDLAQLETAYPTSWRTLMNNCGLSAFGFQNRRLADQWSGYFDMGPAQLRAFSPDEQIVMLPGRGEHRVKRLDYLRDPEFTGQFDDNPLYAPVPPDHFLLAPACSEATRVETAVAEVERPARPRKSSIPGGGNGGLNL